MGSDYHHADLANFEGTETKAEMYDSIFLACKGLFHEQRNWVCNLSNTASLLWHGYRSRLGTAQEHVNWAGFYVRNPQAHIFDPGCHGELILGPFQGKVACQTIHVGKGVCGAAAAEMKTHVVPNVEWFPGHIACDGETRSEIVVPILRTKQDGQKEVIAVIDIDCEHLNGFDEEDQSYLEKLAELLSKSCDWPF